MGIKIEGGSTSNGMDVLVHNEAFGSSYVALLQCRCIPEIYPDLSRTKDRVFV